MHNNLHRKQSCSKFFKKIFSGYDFVIKWSLDEHSSHLVSFNIGVIIIVDI